MGYYGPNTMASSGCARRGARRHEPARGVLRPLPPPAQEQASRNGQIGIRLAARQLLARGKETGGVETIKLTRPSRPWAPTNQLLLIMFLKWVTEPSSLLRLARADYQRCSRG